jgi:peptidoglycan/xylan/chitin deacetylase (PgdA/CDA1 family)
MFRVSHGLRIPILMYHSISDTKEDGVHPYYQINTSPRVFAEHMRFLHENNYSVISLSEAVTLLSVSTSTTQPLNHSTNLARFAVLTFDDGYMDFFASAFPILKNYGFTATVFLPTAFIDKSVPGLKGKEHLSWSEVRELQEEGITFGSHTINHPQLQSLSRDQVEYEISKSKEIIEERTGKTVVFFCYPYKFPEQDQKFVGLLKTLLQTTGYQACTTTRIGCASDSTDYFFLSRLPINSGDDISFLKAKISGNYNWLGKVQHLTKVFAKLMAGAKHKQYIRAFNLARKSDV